MEFFLLNLFAVILIFWNSIHNMIKNNNNNNNNNNQDFSPKSWSSYGSD